MSSSERLEPGCTGPFSDDCPVHPKVWPPRTIATDPPVARALDLIRKNIAIFGKLDDGGAGANPKVVVRLFEELQAVLSASTVPAEPEAREPERFDPLVHLPGEYEVGRLIRASVEHDAEKMRFYLTCSVGELAQRIVLAALAAPDQRIAGAVVPDVSPGLGYPGRPSGAPDASDDEPSRADKNRDTATAAAPVGTSFVKEASPTNGDVGATLVCGCGFTEDDPIHHDDRYVFKHPFGAPDQRAGQDKRSYRCSAEFSHEGKSSTQCAGMAGHAGEHYNGGFFWTADQRTGEEG